MVYKATGLRYVASTAKEGKYGYKLSFFHPEGQDIKAIRKAAVDLISSGKVKDAHEVYGYGYPKGSYKVDVIASAEYASRTGASFVAVVIYSRGRFYNVDVNDTHKTTHILNRDGTLGKKVKTDAWRVEHGL